MVGSSTAMSAQQATPPRTDGARLAQNPITFQTPERVCAAPVPLATLA